MVAPLYPRRCLIIRHPPTLVLLRLSRRSIHPHRLIRSLGLSLLSCCVLPAFPNIVLVQFNSHWKYLDNGSNQGTAWRASVFPAESTCATGHGEFGYGDDDGRTVVSYGPNASAKYITT